MGIVLNFIVWCLAEVIINIFCIYIIRKQKDMTAKTVRKIIWLVVLATLVCIVAAVSDSYKVISVAFAVRYASMVWICYFLVEYVCRYTKPKENLLWVDDVWKLILLFDTVSLLMNVFYEHKMSFELIGEGKAAYWVMRPGFLYKVHLSIIAIMVAEIAIRLILGWIKSPTIYKRKYWGLLIVFGVALAGDLGYYFAEDALDASILFFAAGSAILVYNSFYIVPEVLKKKMIVTVLGKMEDTLVMFDDKGNCVYLNNKWRENNVVMDMKLNDFQKHIISARDKQGALCVDYGSEACYYEDRYDELRDKKGRYIGCYYIFRDVTEERKLLHIQHFLANFDQLTGLYNRERFFRYSARLMKEIPDEPFLIICTDIRKMKVINEVFGLSMGDKLLKLVAEAIHNYTDKVRVYGRVDADTFAMCIPEKYFDVDKFINDTNSAIKMLDVNYPIINHVGIYRVEDRSLTVSAMCDRAMLAVNSIKSDYMREIIYYDESLRNKLLHDQEVIAELQTAFDEKQFIMYLQPQFNHKTGRIIGSEALVRWVHPEKGLIAPGEFIPLLEKNGLITNLDLYVWELACKQLQQWKSEGKTGMSISVNISNKDFYYIDIYKVLSEMVDKYDINTSDLKLEITESAFSIDLVRQLEVIEKLQEKGFIIEMDDFGSGYSSLNSLKDIPVNVLKMDMIFMQKSDRYKRREDILQMIVAMANKLKLPVIAEGVETKEQADFLSEIGCEIIQGYYYAKPMPVSDFEALLEQKGVEE